MSDPYYDSQPQNSTLAIISLAAGILGLTFFPGIASVVAIITAYMAEKEIQESHGSLDGANYARWGKILGWIGIAIGVLIICCVVLFLVLGFSTFTVESFSSLFAPMVIGLV